MTDPAVEAAQRYAATLPFGFGSRLTGAALVFAAREALAPIRELHKKTVCACELCDHEPYCDMCGWDYDWPCPTARLIYREDEL